MKATLFTLAISILICTYASAQTKDTTDNEDYYEHSTEDSVETTSGEYMPTREAVYNTARMSIIKERKENIDQDVSLPKSTATKGKYFANRNMQSKIAYNNKMPKESLLLRRQKQWTSEK